MQLFKKKKGSFVPETIGKDNPNYLETEFGGGKTEENDDKDEHGKPAAGSHPEILVSIIGEFGRFQFIFILLVGMTTITNSWINYVNKFLTYEVEYWCEKPDILSNLSVSEWLNISAPFDSKGNFNRCQIFDVDYSLIQERPNNTTPTIACHSWEFAQEPFTNTAMQRWSLVCDRDTFYFKTTSQSLLFVGHFAGSLIAGFIADRFGRKTAFVFFLFPAIGCLLLSSFIDNPYVWTALRFFIGLANMGGVTARSVYTIEFTSGKWKSFSQHYANELFFTLSHITSAILIYLVPDMKTAELVMALSMVPYILYWVVIPESPRWLITKGHTAEARKVLTRGLKMNKLPLSRLEYLDESEQVDATPKAFFTDLLRYPSILRNLICMSFCWFTFAMGNYGLIYNTPSFDWNIYLTFAMPAFLKLPINIVMPFIENKLGRKFMLFFTLTLAGVLLLCCLTIPDGMFSYNWPVMMFAWIGTVSAGSGFGVGSIYTKELFPTTHRTMAFSVVSAAARIGSISSPFVAMLDEFNPIFSLAVYGFWLLAGGIVSIWISPETKTMKIIDTLDEGEEVSSQKNPWLICKKQ